MANDDRKAKKRNFTQCEIEVLVGEVEARKNILFSGLSAGITNAKQALEWQHVADAVNAAGSEGQILSKIKKEVLRHKSRVFVPLAGERGHRNSPPL